MLPCTRCGPTFLAALALVARVADAGAHDAGAVVAAGHIDALAGGHVTLGALPSTVAQAPALHVLAIPAAEHRAGGCRDSTGSLASINAWHGPSAFAPFSLRPAGQTKSLKCFATIPTGTHLSASWPLFYSSLNTRGTVG